MKYLLLIYSSPATWQALPGQQRERMTREHAALVAELTASGEYVGGHALADATHARVVRVRETVPMITDGPYAEVKEQLAGYDVVDCDSIERATEIAARLPEAGLFAVEVRPVMDLNGMEM
ncbi:YciI family protein [Micromonospora sp. URMC 103]|uniref:YciI family protein n=1 Tax=Micromonospora sp. URMC 103 TaxID=3423406 RepID=UPI003F1CFC3F